MLNKAVKSAFLASVATMAASCAGGPFNGPEHAKSVAEMHPIAVDSQVVTLTIDSDPAKSELSEVDKARLRAFAGAYLRNGHGALTITAPSGASTDFDGQEAAADIRKALNDAGVSWETLAGATYRTGTGRQLIVSYTRYVATPSECGIWTDTTVSDYRNLRSPNYGCATQNNIAAMLADPHDLIAPAEMGPRDAEAVVRAFTAYREGTVTASETDGEIDASLSN